MTVQQAVPLEGLHVLDLSEGVSGPFATKLLGAMGADVIKVEPTGGDAARREPPFLGDDPHPEKSGLFLYLNTNKRSVTLDLRQSSGRAILHRLAAWADIVVESHAPAERDDYGLGYEALRTLNPRLILVSVTPFGQDGPYRDYQGSDLVALALGGLLYITGAPDREPLRIGGRPAEYLGGLSAFSGAMVALHAQRLTGRGQHVDVSLVEGIATAQMYSSLSAAYTGEDRERVNSFAPMFAVKDGYVGVMYRQQNWPAFCRMIDRPDLIDDERFRDVGARRRHAEELNAIVAPWMAQREKAELYHSGQAQRMPFGYICDAGDLLASPQYETRGYFVELDHPVAGTLRYPGMPLHWGAATWRLSRAPLLGEHNAEIYGGLLGYSDQQRTILRGAGVI